MEIKDTGLNTKEKILTLLKESQGAYLSGQKIADTLYVTRACVWKSIKALMSEGYEIDAVTNKGYRLKQKLDALDSDKIMALLMEHGIDIPVLHLDSVTSTNDYCEQYCKYNHSDCIIVADTQTNGRGRRGRDFFSPQDTGLYFSILLYPPKTVDRLTDFTAYAACATALSIDKVLEGSKKTCIKWVNDIFLNDLKVAGILCEAHTSLEDPDDTHIVIGIGINTYAPTAGFPKELTDIAGAVIGSGENSLRSDLRNRLVAEIATLIHHYALDGQAAQKECLRAYREKSFLIGNYVKINDFTPNSKYALVTGISDDYHLEVKYDDGKCEALSSVEVSVVKY